MKNLKTHSLSKAIAAKATSLLCLLNFNHSLTSTGFEDGKGSDFRYVSRCNCGKRKEAGEWTDDNQLQGYGRTQ